MPDDTKPVTTKTEAKPAPKAPAKTPHETLQAEVTKLLAEANAEVLRLEAAGLPEAAHHARLAAAAFGDAEGGLNKAWWKLRQAADHQAASQASEEKNK